MDSVSPDRQSLRLSQLNSLIKAAVTEALPDLYWIVAEIAELKQNQRGHCYLDLVEKEDEATLAQIRATIWAYEYRTISSRFKAATGEPLTRGMKILFLAAVSFHEVYGLSLNIKEIDPTYTLGEMARKKREVIERLRKEGLINRNKALELPLVPQKIAVISSPTAAGYDDFLKHLDDNPYGYRISHVLFPAVMQGNGAEASIIKALKRISRMQAAFDLIAIIRGGGSTVDLSCFDSYALAAQVATCPLPVISGIGHEKDDSVVDIVAHTRMKTPTAVAEFIISGARAFEETVLGLESRMARHAGEWLQNERRSLALLGQRLSHLPLRLRSIHLNRLSASMRDIRTFSRQTLVQRQNRLDSLAQAVKHLDPLQVLKRGYSITRHKGKVVRDASLLRPGMVIESSLHTGTVTSIVQQGKEKKSDGKEQGADLLPGLE